MIVVPKKPRFARGLLSSGLALTCALGLPFACCAQKRSAPPSGLEGVVLRGPMCPGPVRPDRPCPDQPFSAAFQVLGQDRTVVATFRSDESGRFQVALAPGEYTVVPEGGHVEGNPLGDSARVTVREGETTQVILRWDTGMR